MKQVLTISLVGFHKIQRFNLQLIFLNMSDVLVHGISYFCKILTVNTASSGWGVII